MRSTNQIALVAGSVMAIFAVAHALDGQLLRGAFQIAIFLSLMLSVFGLNHRGYLEMARICLVGNCCAAIFLDAAIGGPLEGHQYFFVVMALSFGVLFEPTNWRSGVIAFALPLSSWLLLEVTGYRLLEPYFGPHTNDAHARILNIFLSYFVIFGVVARFSYLNMLAEQKALRAAKMAALGEVAAGMGHEINNPLAVVIGRLNQARSGIAAQRMSTQEVLHTLEKIIDPANRIAKIIRSLTKFSRASAHDPFEMCCANGLIYNSLELCRHKIKSKEIDIRVQVAEGLEFDCRPSEIMQVLVNLINNSADAVEDLEERWISLEAGVVEDCVRLAVTDSGAGISKEVEDLMLKPFFTTKAPGKGTGLGLSVSQGLIKSHGGHLKLNREAGNTQIEVFLPQYHGDARETNLPRAS